MTQIPMHFKWPVPSITKSSNRGSEYKVVEQGQFTGLSITTILDVGFVQSVVETLKFVSGFIDSFLATGNC